MEQILSNLEAHKNITESIFNEELKLGYVEGEYSAQNLIQMMNFTEYSGMMEKMFTPSDKYIWQRSDITFRYNQQRLTFNKMITVLIDSIDEQENLLKEEDRKVFEEILSDTLSRKLSARIFSSKAWVKKMNVLMEGLSTSMGLTF